MTGADLKTFRRRVGWTQVRLARRMGVTQAYLSLVEGGRRRLTERAQRRVTSLLGLQPTSLPVSSQGALEPTPEDASVERDLARLGYPALAYRRKRGARRNPGEVLLMALSLDDLDPRLAEALPWLLVKFAGFDGEDLVARAKSMDLQNRLGFTVALARRVAERHPAFANRQEDLQRLEQALEPSRLAREDTYGRRETSKRMRAWLRENRSHDAAHWNLLTDLKPEHLSYANTDPGTLAKLPS